MTPRPRFLTDAEGLEIAAMFNAGLTVTEIAEKVDRHYTAVSRCLQSASLSRPFQAKPRLVFSNEEMNLLRALADEGLSASQIASKMPGRRKETINGKLQAMGYDRSQGIPVETRRIILNMKAAGHTVRDIAAVVGVSKSAVAHTNSLEGLDRINGPALRRVIDGDICRIRTGSGKHEFICDAADFDLLPQTSIYRGGGGYPVARVSGRITYLHHIIMGSPPPGKVVDHINGDRTDCRRSNLRFATPSQNSQNAVKRGVGKAGYLGVQPAGKRFNANIQVLIGTFDTAEEAARAYDAKAIEVLGEFAMTNAKRGLLDD